MQIEETLNWICEQEDYEYLALAMVIDASKELSKFDERVVR